MMLLEILTAIWKKIFYRAMAMANFMILVMSIVGIVYPPAKSIHDPESNSNAEKKKLEQKKNALDKYAEKIGEFGHLSMTVGGAAVIGLGSDTFKDHPTVKHYLVAYTIIGVIAYEVAKGKKYKGSLSLVLIVIGGIVRMSTLLTTISFFVLPAKLMWMPFLMSFVIVRTTTISTINNHRRSIHSHELNLKEMLPPTYEELTSVVITTGKELDMMEQVYKVIDKKEKLQSEFRDWLKKVGDSGYSYIIAKGVGILGASTAGPLKDYPVTKAYMITYSIGGLVFYEIAKAKNHEGRVSQMCVLLGGIARISIMLTGTIHMLNPKLIWVALIVSTITIAISTLATIFDHEKKVSQFHDQMDQVAQEFKNR